MPRCRKSKGSKHIVFFGGAIAKKACYLITRVGERNSCGDGDLVTNQPNMANNPIINIMDWGRTSHAASAPTRQAQKLIDQRLRRAAKT